REPQSGGAPGGCGVVGRGGVGGKGTGSGLGSGPGFMGLASAPLCPPAHADTASAVTPQSQVRATPRLKLMILIALLFRHGVAEASTQMLIYPADVAPTGAVLSGFRSWRCAHGHDSAGPRTPARAARVAHAKGFCQTPQLRRER